MRLFCLKLQNEIAESCSRPNRKGVVRAVTLFLYEGVYIPKNLSSWWFQTFVIICIIFTLGEMIQFQKGLKPTATVIFGIPNKWGDMGSTIPFQGFDQHILVAASMLPRWFWHEGHDLPLIISSRNAAGMTSLLPEEQFVSPHVFFQNEIGCSLGQYTTNGPAFSILKYLQTNQIFQFICSNATHQHIALLFLLHSICAFRNKKNIHLPRLAAEALSYSRVRWASQSGQTEGVEVSTQPLSY